MKNTFLYDEKTFYHKNRSMGYSKAGEGYRRNIIKYETYGDGQIMTNIYDMYLWDKNFYNNKLGKGNSEIIAQMYTRGQLNNGQSIDYSIGGLEVSQYKGLSVIDRMGGTQGICSDIVRFPDQEFTVICLSNDDDLDPDPWRASLKIADIFLGQYYNNVTETCIKNESSKKVINLSEVKADQIVGIYFNDQSKDNFKIEIKDSTLLLNSKKLIPVDSVSFKIENWSVKVQFDKMGTDSTEISWQSFTFPVEKYMKRSINDYDNNSLEEFIGYYNCSELDLNCRIKLKNNQLSLLDSDNKESVLIPLFKDTFKSSYRGNNMILEYKRDTTDKIAGMNMNTDWIKNLRFKKQEN
jgi:hypothetical protein